ncbi:MAG: adenosylcobinamide-GDP ribazoletransferase, partial [Alphaproteobacteria bacterium]
ARSGAPPRLADSVWAYPLVGALVGAIGAGCYAGAAVLGVPLPLAAVLAVAAMVLATGAFHEDGLADTADGLGGGGDRDAKLAIMRDSRIGTYGTLAVIFSVLVRVVALAGLPAVDIAAAALIGLAGLSRGAIVALLAALPSARTDGMGAVAANPGRGAVLAGGVLALLPLVFWPPPVAVALLATAMAATLIVGLLARAQIGGYTGDVLGAAQQACECACWIVIATLVA